MITSPLHSLRRVFAVAAVALATASSSSAQSFYFAGKIQHFAQYAASGAVADPLIGYRMDVSAATNATFTLPSGATAPLTFSASDNNYALSQYFATKAAIDAAFPNGTYRFTGTSIPTLTVNLTPDLYSSATPQVTGGTNATWSNGFLVVNPAQAATLNFSVFSDYATAGALGHVYFELNGPSNFHRETETFSKAAVGNPAAAALSTYNIPANTLVAGQLYDLDLEYDIFSTLDVGANNVVSAGGFTNKLHVFLMPLAAGTTPPAAPAIATQPVSQSGAVGGRVTFTAAVAGGTATAGVRWYLNGQELPANAKYTYSTDRLSLTVNTLTAADAGAYAVRVFNSGGIATSSVAALTLTGLPVAPAIAASGQPAAQTVVSGSTVVFNVTASGSPAPAYQWRKDGTAIAGATSALLVVNNATAANAGAYSVVATNASGTATSSTAALAISTTAALPRLVNLSILTPLAASESMTMGTVLGGTGTSGTKALLARAAGPSLTAFGLTAVLPAPTMTLNFTTPTPAAVVATNTGWGGTATLSDAFASVGAFAYSSTSSKDSAIFQSALAAGNYTVQVGDAGAGSGSVIAELYDATPAATFSAATPRLINVSVLKQISAGSTLTAGFVIGGTTGKTVLIRAVGPRLALAPFGITGAMAAPAMTLVNTSANATVATNSGWGGDAQIAAVANRVGAFAVTDVASRDAMLLVTLPPANYTAQVGPATGTAGGTVIVEVYEVP